MANTYQLIEAITVGSGGASSVTFSSILGTYTNLKVVCSVRGTAAYVNQSYQMTFNGTSTTGISARRLYGSGSATGSDTNTTPEGVGANATANTFANDEFYIPNYTSGNYKSYNIDNVGENNATTAYAMLHAGLWSNTAAITSIVFTASTGSFVANSTFYLYGIKNS
jgi:hypothetical protein